MVHIKINLNSGVPPSSQLVDSIKKALAEGKLSPGDKLPSIRQLSSDLGMNPKTVAKALQKLERDRLVVSKGYRGSFVSDNADQNFSIEKEAYIRKEIKSTIDRLLEHGAVESEIRNTFVEILKSSRK